MWSAAKDVAQFSLAHNASFRQNPRSRIRCCCQLRRALIRCRHFRGCAASEPVGQTKITPFSSGDSCFPQYFHTSGNLIEAGFLTNIWDKVLQHTERRVNPHSFATWFRPTRQERAEGDHVVVRVPTRTFCKRLTETYGELLKAVFTEIGRPELVLQFVYTESEPA